MIFWVTETLVSASAYTFTNFGVVVPRQPLLVVMLAEYEPEVIAVIDWVVSPVLHK
jgi:hypothetical protein